MLAHIKTRAQMAEALHRFEQAGDTWHAPLIRAAMAGTIRFAILAPGARVQLRILSMRHDPRPLVMVVGGDTGGPATPDAFPQARRLIRWARFVVLHGAGGEPGHYRSAVEAAQRLQRVLIVETTGAALPTWVALKREVAGETPGLIVMVAPGKPAHPREAPPLGVPLQ
jgi:hypothetical protein